MEDFEQPNDQELHAAFVGDLIDSALRESEIPDDPSLQPKVWNKKIENELLNRVVETGDREALGHLVKQYYPVLLFYAQRSLRKGEQYTPEDAVQEAVCSVLARLSRQEELGEPRPVVTFTYFGLYLKSAISHHYRSPHTKRSMPEGDIHGTPLGWSPERPLDELVSERFMAAAALQAIFADIPLDQRSVILAAFVGEPQEEIALQYGIKPNTVRYWVGLARARARQLLEEGEILPPDSVIYSNSPKRVFDLSSR